jgi:hypothetical protein
MDTNGKHSLSKCKCLARARAAYLKNILVVTVSIAEGFMALLVLLPLELWSGAVAQRLVLMPPALAIVAETHSS